MHVSIILNPKHESFQLTAFYEMLATSDHNITIVCDETDLKDPDAPPSLENLGVQSHLLRLVDTVTFTDGKDGGKTVKLHEKTIFLTR
jgi:hypothetical protein